MFYRGRHLQREIPMRTLILILISAWMTPLRWRMRRARSGCWASPRCLAMSRLAGGKNARLFCAKMNISAPVYRGASAGAGPSAPATLHGADGLGDAFDNPYSDVADSAVQFIIDSVRAQHAITGQSGR